MNTTKFLIEKYFLYICFVVLIVISASCSSSPSLLTHWKSSEIIIDGKLSDWQNKLQEVPDKKIWIGFANDDKYFYMSLVTDDRSKVMQMMRGGFITWFIPVSNSQSTFGIKYPLSNKFNPREQTQNFNREMFQQGGLENLVKMFLDKQNEIQIVNSEKYSLSLLPLDNKDGIKAKLGYEDGKLIYELQVPLAVHDDYSFQIAALPGEELKIKFETEQIDAETMRGAMGGTMQRGGTEGGQARGNMPGAGRFTPSEPLNYTVDLKLSIKQ
jgi:hypothetical protein